MAQKRKASKKKPAAKRPQRKKPAKKKIQPVEEILFRVEGKMSTFGGPKDTGMSADEGLALFSQADLQNPKYSYLFLPTQPPATTGLGRRLNHLRTTSDTSETCNGRKASYSCQSVCAARQTCHQTVHPQPELFLPQCRNKDRQNCFTLHGRIAGQCTGRVSEKRFAESFRALRY